MKNTDASSPVLEAFTSSSFPKERRAELERTLQERRAPMARAVACAVLLAMCAGFGLFYGGVCAYAWKTGLHPTVGVLFSILSGITLIGAAAMAYRLHDELQRIPPLPKKLRLEAEAESSLEHAMLDCNLRIYAWNDAIRMAAENRFDGSVLNGLLVQRVAIERQRRKVAAALTRFTDIAGQGAGTKPSLRLIRKDS